MGRIYEAKTTRSGTKLYLDTGAEIGAGVSRVEFDEDTDEGMATVTILIRDSNGGYVVDRDGPVYATFRRHVAIVMLGDSIPEKTRKLMGESATEMVKKAQPIHTAVA